MRDDRVRNWTFIAYPESAPDNWIDILKSYLVPFSVSPLHDVDLNADDTEKKPHWHVVFTFAGNKSFNQVLDITKSVNATIPQKVNNMNGIIRYFIHMDNPEKHQYNLEDIQAFNGFDVDSYFKITSTNRYFAIKEMIEIIRDNDITEYSDFVLWCMENRFDWFKLLCDNCSYVIKEFITSYRNAKKCK